MASRENDASELEPEGAATIARRGHRWYVGEMWDEMGRLQFDFLVAQGLMPHHVLLDIACGCLRGGVHFIRYLDPGHYLGVEKQRRLLELGVREELGAPLYELKRPELLVSGDFEFCRLSRAPDWSLAQSLFTHLCERDLLRCLELRRWVARGHSLYASFFAGDSGHNPGRSHFQARFVYEPDELARLAESQGWRPELLGDWGHPRNQQMMKFVAA